MWNFKVSNMSSHIGKLGSGYVIELNNLDFKMVVLMFKRSCHFCLSLLSIYVVHKLGLSLITLMKCFSKFFKMFLFWGFQNGIKTGDQWTLKNLFNNILDGQCALFQWELLSFHPLCNFVVVATQYYFVWFFK